MPTIVDLDVETLLSILLELDIRDLLVCKRVSKDFRDLVGSSPVQYKFQLVWAAAVDGAKRGLGSKDRLQALKEYQFAWRTFQLPISMTFSKFVSFTPPKDPFRLLKFSGPFVAMHVGSNLKIYRLASAKRRVPGMTWSTQLASLGQKPLLGASDQRENVVAICGATIGNEDVFRCNFLTLLPDGSIRPHPLATRAALGIEPTIGSPGDVIQADMLGDILVLAVRGQVFSSLYVLDWKTSIILLHMRCTGPSSIFAHFLDRNLLLIGYQDNVYIHAIDTTRGPNRSTIPLCFLRPPQGGFYIEGIPSQPASSPTDEDGLFHSDPNAALLVLHFSCPFRYRGQTDYVFCIPRAALLANIGFSPATATSPAAVRSPAPQWEDWSRGGELLFCMGIMQTTRPDISVSAFGSRVAIVFNMQRAGGPPRMSQSTVYAFEMHRWAWARDGIETRAPGTVLHVFDFRVLPDWGIVRPRDPLPYGIYKQDVVYVDDGRRSHKKFVLLLEDTVALVREDLLEVGGVPTTTHCYMSRT
ncbi:uncharacterized protein TRAVEDRAFT_54092 [Trametes versicolor FP-101664 SS1]|uniref:F-box domain-containing protein n=1 Tax=Trametes versicolor (strain FP-101664) TaxID=717944 RepID=R7SB27_TRAVS|nr:uncharacterized protein TRAVEDRAFT_54092 [Trametes versicolor FP-101664 SS1]EIW52119.1 hypothetical protein TRAVEDRAFT_54092 [Trametes versicolor FP-101664 SS1]